MKRNVLLLLAATLLVAGNWSPATAQVAIGSVNDSITPGALLDLSQAVDAGGLLLPQIESTDTLSDELRKPGMLVYNKTDGKVYTYNGTAWSVGSGGDTPRPDPSSCSGTVTGVSGNEYPIGSYPNATNGLEYLCWTLSNLMEPGASFTSYPGETENRGYYYKYTQVVLDNTTGKNLCSEIFGNQWHTPSEYECLLLASGLNEMSDDEKKPWVSGDALAGYSVGNPIAWSGWDTIGYWRIHGETRSNLYTWALLIRISDKAASVTAAGQVNHSGGAPVRCVKRI